MNWSVTVSVFYDGIAVDKVSGHDRCITEISHAAQVAANR